MPDYHFKVVGDFDPPDGPPERDRDWVDLVPAEKGCDLPKFTVGNDEMSRLQGNQKFLIRKGPKNWYDISVRRLDEVSAKRAVAAILTNYLGLEKEVSPNEIVFQKA